MDVSKEIRIQRLVDEYGSADRHEFLLIMGKVVKKLGGQNFNMARDKLLQGDLHATIDILLTYYDKAYLNSINKRLDRLRLTVPWNGADPDGCASELIEKVSGMNIVDRC